MRTRCRSSSTTRFPPSTASRPSCRYSTARERTPPASSITLPWSGPSASSGPPSSVQRSTDRILTTHTGSLPRPADLVELLYAAEKGQQPVELEARAAEAVAECVGKQRQAGVDVVNDGEMGKVSYS